MRATDLLKQSIAGYRKSINPPYRKKDLFSIAATLFILLAIPLTVVGVYFVRQFGAPAKGNPVNMFTFTKTFFGGEGNIIATEQKSIEDSGKSEAFINGEKESDLTASNNMIVIDTRSEAEALKNYIVELSNKNLGQRNLELKKNKANPSEIKKELTALKTSIAVEHSQAKTNISKALGKQLTVGIPGKNERKVTIELDTTFNGFVIELLPDEIDKVKSIKGVKRVTADTALKVTLDVSVPMIKATDAWPFIDSKGAPLTGFGMKIGIIDTGVDYTHVDLGGCFGPGCKVAGGWDFVNNDANPMDDHGHGTHVSATATGKGALLGVAPDATIYGYKVCNSGGSCSGSAVMAAIDRCLDPNQDSNFEDHLDVCSMSLGGDGNPDDLQSLAADNAVKNGVVLTIAAGNNGPSAQTITSPGTSRLAITVGAACKPADIGINSRCSSAIASFSSRGPVKWTDINGVAQEMIKPDIVSPGVNICAAEWDSWLTGNRCKDTTHIAIAGTSMATPHVAGMAALLRQAVPVASPADIKTAIKTSAVPYPGFDENNQGKGLINTLEALKILSPNLDFSASLSSTPFSWNLESGIGSPTFTTNQTFTIKNHTTAATTAILTAQNLPPGLTISLDKNSLSIPAVGTATFTATMTGDNNVLVSGKTYIANILVNSPVKSLSIAVLVKVPKRISTTNTIDFGLDLPDFVGTWTSAKSFQITNLQSVSGSYNLSVVCCQGPSGSISSGIGVSLSSSSVNLSPNGSQIVSATASVNNSAIPNGVYSGNIVVSSGLQEPIHIAFTITKFYRLTINYPADNKPWFIEFHNNPARAAGQGLVSNESMTFLLASKYSPIDIIGVWKQFETSTNPTNTLTYIVKEDFVFDGDENVFLDPATAIYTFTSSYTGINSENISRPTIQSQALKDKSSGRPNLDMSHSNGSSYIYKFNPISSDYVFSKVAFQQYKPLTSTEVRKGIGFEYVVSDGINANRTFTNTVADLKLIPVYGYPGTNDETVRADIGACHFGAGISMCSQTGSLDKEVQKSNNYRYDFYTIPVNNLAQANKQLMYWTFGLSTTDFYFASNLIQSSATVFDPAGIVRWLRSGENSQPSKPNRLDIGILPFHFYINWILSRDFKYAGSFSTGSLNLGQEWDEDRFDYGCCVRKINYRIFRDGVNIGEGLFGNTLNFQSIVGNTPGNYEVEIYDTVPINGVNTNHSIRGRFTLTSTFGDLTDAKPPTTTSFDFLSDGIPAQVVDPNRNHTLRFGLNPLPAAFGTDSISKVELLLDTDVSNQQSLSLSSSVANEYTAQIPVIANANLYTFTLTAFDNYGNSMVYKFELPKGTVIGDSGPPPPTDASPPTVAITSPSNGATVSGNVNVGVNATDDIGVTKVEFSVDGVVKNTDTSAPYSYSWDSSTVSNGAHSLSAKAHDASGKTATSSINITVQNLDLTPPTVSITSPASGATVSGSVNIAANATDNVGVSRVDFRIDGVVVNSDTTSPYAYSWNSTSVSNGLHSIGAYAYDATGNVANVAINVTVQNGDTTPPSTPTGLTASGVSYNRVNLTWTASTDNVGVTGYWVVRNGVTIAQTPTNSFSDSTVMPSSGYSYFVFAVDAVGNNSPASNTVTVTTPATPDTQAPTTPVNLTATAVSSSQINLSWTASSDNVGVTGYDVYRNGARIATVTTTSFGNTGLSANTSYSYYVRAKDAASNVSAPSNTVSATTWSAPAQDSDRDGFSDAIELYIGTDPAKSCGNPRDQKLPFKPSRTWPLDTYTENGEQDKLSIQDISAFLSPVRRLDTVAGDANYHKRYDLDANRVINTDDINKYQGTTGQTCSR